MSSLYNTESSYSPISKFFHWLIAFLVIMMLLVSYFLSDIPNNTLKAIAFNAHKLTGLTILTLMILRTAWVLINPKPRLPNTKLWERWTEHFVHWSLYLALLAMPLAGWIGSVAGGKPPMVGYHHLKLPLGKNPELSDLAFSVHNTVAIIIIILVSLHILAALYHYFFKRDQVLQRIWP